MFGKHQNKLDSPMRLGHRVLEVLEYEKQGQELHNAVWTEYSQRWVSLEGFKCQMLKCTQELIKYTR